MSNERQLSGLRPRASGDVSRLLKANRDTQPPQATQQSAQPAASQTHRLTEAQTLAPLTPPVAAPRPAATHPPKYLQLRRREARIHHDQEAALSNITRRLNNARRQPDGSTMGERITDNTLLRIAIDLLLQRADDLHGTTETELAESLGLQRRTS